MVASLSVIDGPTRAHFDPRLYVPIEIGSRIIVGQFGDVIRGGGSSGGSFDFALGDTRPGVQAIDNPIWAFLALGWKGRTFRLYQGERTTRFEDLDLVYTGRVDDIQHDTLRASIKITDASIDIDDVLVDDLYPDDDTVLEAIRGRPKPELRGSAYNVAPIFLNEAVLIYQVSRLPLADIIEVRVGGIAWDRVDSNPEPGEWSADLANGKFTLGGITGGLDVRCDARGVGWDTLTTARLMTDIITDAGGEIDAAAMAALGTGAPYLIGWWTGTDEVNRLSALDQIMGSVLGWWGVGIDGKLTAGLIDAPEVSVDLSLNGVDIDNLQLSGLLPPAWRVRVEHTRNWSPSSSFAGAVTEADRQRWQGPGTNAPAWSDDSIKATEKRAVDLPLIRSLVNSEADALAIRDRATRAFGVPRRMYEAKAWVDAPALGVVASVDYLMVSGQFQVHGVVRSFGGGPTSLQLWG